MGVYTLQAEQVLYTDIQTAWDFLCNPQNLRVITPEYMGFVVHTPNLPEKIYPGLMIQYTVRPVLRIPMRWVTEITHVSDKTYFVDEQRVGPYRIWHHEHHIQQIDSGVLMRDIVTYQPPMGVLGSVANVLFIRRQLNQIFNYRRKVLNNMFGEATGDRIELRRVK